jgi:mannose-6-phosphate isomerase-like protein (cupin superfamily)
VFTAPGSATNGQYGLFEWNMTGTPGGADPHFHKRFSESFYIMEGTVRLFNGETWIDAVKGDFLYVPQGGIHAFSNESGAAARMLIMFAPGPTSTRPEVRIHHGDEEVIVSQPRPAQAKHRNVTLMWL